jgi:hypothetical protein
MDLMLDTFLKPWVDAFVKTSRENKGDESRSAIGMLVSSLGRMLRMRGVFRRRARLPVIFFIITSFHFSVAVMFGLYPYLVRTTKWDGFYMLAGLAVFAHWMLCMGECLVSWVEKKLFYEEYTMGAAPLHHWFMDAMPVWKGLSVVALFVTSWCLATACVMLRNIEMDGCGVRMAAQFGDIVTIKMASHMFWGPSPCS